MQFNTENGCFAFLSPHLGGLGAMYDDHLKLIGKCVVDFLLVLTELFFSPRYQHEVTGGIYDISCI